MDTQSLLATQPELYKQQLMRSLKLYKASFFHVFHFALLLSITFFIPRLMTLVIGHDIFLGLSPFSLKRLWVELIAIIGVFFYAALLWRMRCIIFNVHESLFEDMKIAIKRLFLIIVASVIQSLIFSFLCIGIIAFYHYLVPKALFFQSNLLELPLIMSGLLFYLIAVVYLYFLFIFYLPLILAEKKGALTALGKSVFLVWKNWWRTFWLQITPWGGYLVCLIIIKQVFSENSHLYFGLGQQVVLFATVLRIMIFALFVPWIIAILLVQLRDLELRKNYTMLHGKKRTKNSTRL